MRANLYNSIAWVLSGICLLALGVFLSVGSWAPVQQFAFLDFYDYYFAAQATARGVNPYDGAITEGWAEAAGVPFIPGSDYIYPVWFAIALQPLLLLPPRVAALAWFMISIVVLLATLRRWLRHYDLRALAAALLFPPTLFTLFIGQVNILLFALLAISWNLRMRRPLLAGAALGVSMAIKLSPVLFLPLLLWTRRWKMVGSALTMVTVLIVAGEIVAPGSTSRYFGTVLPGLAAPVARPAHPVNQSLNALLLRLLTPNAWTYPLYSAPWLVRPLSWLLSAVLLCLLVARSWLWSQDRLANEQRLWSAVVPLVVMLSPLAWESSYVLLLLPLSWLRAEGVGTRWLGTAWLLFLLQRALDPFANDPKAYPWLMRLPFASSWALAGALLLYITALRPRGRCSPKDTGTDSL